MSRLKTLQKALLLVKRASQPILAQVDGPAGVGKTTLMENIEKRGYSVIDLDVFDEQATKEFGLDDGWKSSEQYSDKLLAKVHKLRQKLLDNWLEENDPAKSIVFGIHTEGDTRYRINTDNKILLVDDVSKIVDRRIKRDGLGQADRASLKKETLGHIKELKDLGFLPMKADEILSMFGRIKKKASEHGSNVRVIFPDSIPSDVLLEADSNPEITGFVHPNQDRQRAGIYLGDQLVGFMTPREERANKGWRVGAIFIGPEFKGLGLNIGSKAIAQFFANRKAAPVPISTTNIASQKAFESAGFKREESYPDIVEDDGWTGQWWVKN